MPAVGPAYEMPDSPKGKITTDDVGQRSYTRRFRVQMSLYSDGLANVSKAAGVPRLFTPYVFGSDKDQYALARSLEAERMGPNSLFWVVTVEYRTFSKSELLLQYENPLLVLPEVETSIERFQEPIYFVYDVSTEALTPCRNSAGQVFDPPPMRDNSRLTLRITRNESISTLHPAVDLAYTDAVNADVFWGCPAGTWKCTGITSKREIKQLASGTLFPYLRCGYAFEARPRWDLLILDAGAYYKTSGEVPKRFIFTGDDGQPRIGLLDGTGGKLADGERPVYRTFRTYLRKPFAPLNLPQTFASVA